MTRTRAISPRTAPRSTPIGLTALLIQRALSAAAFALLCLWSRSLPAALARQLSPDVLPL